MRPINVVGCISGVCLVVIIALEWYEFTALKVDTASRTKNKQAVDRAERRTSKAETEDMTGRTVERVVPKAPKEARSVDEPKNITMGAKRRQDASEFKQTCRSGDRDAEVRVAKVVHRWGHFTRASAREHGIDWRWIAAVIAVESSGEPHALGNAREIGLMQILPSTGQLLGYSQRELWNPATNIKAGSRYLSEQYHATRSPTLAFHRYNGGPGARFHGASEYANRVLRHLRVLHCYD